mmetsp:Transcript_34979/g.74535  ORF Transcript_34979/g.74535 Transcript_34979/m.74535 type:complete len:381 (-) Transcript_34979:8-1150(-)
MVAADSMAGRECGPLALGLGALTIVTSAALISFNKYLIHPDRFPFAVPLVMLHMAVSFVLSACLRFVRPSLFPSLTNPAEKVPIDARLFTKGLLPIGVFFVGQLVLSNTAYLYSSVAFLQMMKESNLVLVYSFSLLVALERFKYRNLRLLILIVIATMTTIKGELHFSLGGFALQGTSQLFESMKIVLTGLLLSAGGVRLDALSYVLLMTPGCLCLLGCLLGFLYMHPVESMAVPRWSDVAEWWPLLLANACVAYALNIVSSMFIKHSSPVAYILAGIVKDASIVFAGVLCLRESISKLQAFGFALQLSLIFVWTLMKTYPESFEDGILPGLQTLLVRAPKLTTAPEVRSELVSSEARSGGSGAYGAMEEGRGGTGTRRD